jgi:riboflavin kinase/FMN adenylyltransferase
MRILGSFDDPGIPSGGVWGIGNFDGLHVGHLAVVARVLALARRGGRPSGVLTFDPHPQALLTETPPPLIYTREEKEAIMAGTGLDFLVFQPFDREFASQSADRFIRRVLREGLRPSAVVVGHDFRFGAGGQGTATLLGEEGGRHAFATAVVDEVMVEGMPVRSSRIRDLVAGGDVATARRLLGRPFSVRGRVVEGSRLGRRLGFPTANLEPPAKLLPADGVYAGRAVVDDVPLPAALVLGSPAIRPTPGRVLEAHILDFRGNLYGRTVDLLFLRRIRDFRPFTSPEELAARIAADVEEVRRILAEAT